MTDPETRAAAILLPGETIEEIEPEAPKDPTTGSEILDTMLAVVGNELAKSQATMAAVQDSMNLLPDGYAGPRTLAALGASPGTVVRSMVNSTVLLPGGTTLSPYERVLIPTREVLGNLKFRNLIANGVIRCTEILSTSEQKDITKLDRGRGPATLPDSITMVEMMKLQRAAVRYKRTRLPVAKAMLKEVVAQIVTKYDLDAEVYSINLETGEFVRRDQDEWTL